MFQIQAFTRYEFCRLLPNIPYTPMRDGSIDEVALTSSATDPPDPKRSCPMTPAKRKARSLQAQSAKKREEAREKNLQGKGKMRSQQSTVEKRSSQGQEPTGTGRSSIRTVRRPEKGSQGNKLCLQGFATIRPVGRPKKRSKGIGS